MLEGLRGLRIALGAALVVVASAACSSNESGEASAFGGGRPGVGDASSDAGGGQFEGGGLLDVGTGTDADDAPRGFDVQPSTPQTIHVAFGASAPGVAFSATLDGKPVNVGWSVDRGDLGSVAALGTTTTFTPSGATGGLVTVLAGLNGQTLQRQVMIELEGAQNGADAANPAEQPQLPVDVATLTAGGGVGGVGGEGLGPAVSDASVLTALGAPASDGAAEGLRLLYPYDGTVWPRGLLAPLLMWDGSVADADAILVHLETTSGSFSWTGTFGRPAILAQTGGAFVRHPIPQDVWAAATNTAGGPTLDGSTDRLVVRLVVAKGGQAYGPLSQTWTIAPARLAGIIYYNSYGTNLAKNFTGARGGDGRFGGAVLSIHVGDTGPSLVAGASGASSQCRVCHSVAANGSRLVAARGDSRDQSSAYDLAVSGSSETFMGVGATFPAIFPDGSLALTESGQLLPLPAASALGAVSGLDAVATDVGTPSFSPDGTAVVFNPMSGPGVGAPGQQLFTMSFDVGTGAFSNPTLIADFTGQPAQTRPGWPAFFPDGKSVVFQSQSAAGSDGNGAGALYTRKGARAQIAWTSAADAQHVAPLDRLNGKDAAQNVYLPKLATPVSLACSADGTSVGGIDADHGDDVDLNYEPTVNPIASGGYAWVVFTSRRMYGNEATIPPFCSDPRGVDLVSQVTTKKLWVAAVDVNGQPGTDPSHPAFYLPAQELLAGNARGFWTLDPCRADGEGCASGDQCCNGYCEPGDGGALVCSNTPPNGHCSDVQEKCATAADCCDTTNLCSNGFCAQNGPH